MKQELPCLNIYDDISTNGILQKYQTLGLILLSTAPHPRFVQMMSSGPGAAWVSQARRSWCSMDVLAIACQQRRASVAC